MKVLIQLVGLLSSSYHVQLVELSIPRVVYRCLSSLSSSLSQTSQLYLNTPPLLISLLKSPIEVVPFLQSQHAFLFQVLRFAQAKTHISLAEVLTLSKLGFWPLQAYKVPFLAFQSACCHPCLFCQIRLFHVRVFQIMP